MARNYPANTREQKFWEQTIDKERDARLAWFEELKGRRDGVAEKSKTMEVMRRRIEGDHKPIELIEAKLPADRKPKQYHKRATTNLDQALMAMGDRQVDSLVEMKPASPATLSKLYKGFTKEGLGRSDYLRRRHERIPETKFDFPLLNSWEYGWKLDDVIKKDEIKAPTYGRGKIVQDTFYRRRGILPVSEVLH